MVAKTRITVWPMFKHFNHIGKGRSLQVNTTAATSGLSPFRIGPCELYDGLTSRNMENAWQYSKVYKQHLGAKGHPSPDWWEWAIEGWADPVARRYPMGKGAVPEYSYWKGKHLGYIEARKTIYAPLYIRGVLHTVEWKMLEKNYNSGEFNVIVLRDYDAYNHHTRNMTLTDVLNCPKRKMGHAFVLAMMLQDDDALQQIKRRK